MDLKDNPNSFTDLFESIKKEIQTVIADKSNEDTNGRQKPKRVEISASAASKKPPSKPETCDPEDSAEPDIDLEEKPSYQHLPATYLDEDIAKMKADLQKSYELFQSIGDKFQTINFNSLKTRIRNMHVDNTNNREGKATAEELQKIFQKEVFANRLDKLTSEAGVSFRKHPGEFGDIPEISSFFKACTQLEHGLQNITRQRKKSKKLGHQIMQASETSLDRIDSIRNIIKTNKHYLQ